MRYLTKGVWRNNSETSPRKFNIKADTLDFQHKKNNCKISTSSVDWFWSYELSNQKRPPIVQANFTTEKLTFHNISVFSIQLNTIGFIIDWHLYNCWRVLSGVLNPVNLANTPDAYRRMTVTDLTGIELGHLNTPIPHQPHLPSITVPCLHCNKVMDHRSAASYAASYPPKQHTTQYLPRNIVFQ